MMTERVANKLNALRIAANNPIKLKGRFEDGFNLDTHRCRKEDELAILEYIEACRARVAPAAIHEEIMRAAKDGRLADTYTAGESGCSLMYWGLVNGHYKGAGGIAWTLVRPDVEREIDRLNTLREMEYEAYRLACEQGVAVEPAEMSR